jgi:hypothetical protein
MVIEKIKLKVKKFWEKKLIILINKITILVIILIHLIITILIITVTIQFIN